MAKSRKPGASGGIKFEGFK